MIQVVRKNGIKTETLKDSDKGNINTCNSFLIPVISHSCLIVLRFTDLSIMAGALGIDSSAVLLIVPLVSSFVLQTNI